MLRTLLIKLHLKIRAKIYQQYSTNKRIFGKCIECQPVVIKGKGKVEFGKNVKFGVIDSPLFLNSYAYIESRTEKSNIKFGNNININNSFSVVSENKIIIKDNVLIGYNCSIVDSNFHNLEIEKRLETDPNPKAVIIEKNVFIGNNVTILKGVHIGENCVIASGAIVTKRFPENTIIGGIPAKIIRSNI